MKKFILLGVLFLLVIQVYSKDVSQIVAAQQIIEPSPIYIAMIAKGIRTKLWNPIMTGAQQAANDLGAYITFEGPQTEYSLDEQILLFEKALRNNAQAIAISAIDAGVFTPYLEEAQRRGIPIIAFNSGLDSPIVKTTVATDSYGAGELAADKLAELIGGQGQVAILIQDPVGKTSTDRRDAFSDTMEQRYPDIEIVAIEYGLGDVQLSKELTERIIQQYPDLKGIFGGTEATTSGIINAIRELGLEGKIKVIGFDSGKLLKDAIREGVVEGAITQNPREIGYRTIEAAIREYRGERNPEYIDTGFAWYDKSNIDDPEIQQMLYE